MTIPLTREEYKEKVQLMERHFMETIKDYGDWLVVSSALHNFTTNMSEEFTKQGIEALGPALGLNGCNCAF